MNTLVLKRAGLAGLAGLLLPSSRRGPWVLLGLGVALLASLIWSSGQGAFGLPLRELPAVLAAAFTTYWWPGAERSAAELVFFNIRLPRLVLAVAAGAGLGVAGALMQGLFRNPLADPGLIGVSSGAALAAAFAIVLGSLWWPEVPLALGTWPLMLMAFLGGLLVTALIYTLSLGDGGTRVGIMLLAGIAINALAGAGIGLLSYLATDEQLRNLQFWMLGSLGGARWEAVLVVGLIALATVVLAQRLARPLNALALGEAQAVMLGVPVERLKLACILLTALVVGAVTATTGIIGFIGLVAPHIVRLLAGPDHRWVLPGSALLGAVLVLLADAWARTVIAPAELPLGIITALVGVPFFLLLLRSAHARTL
ncbi:ABC-type Fe3+-siderophore transport system, permease component [Serpentinimonas maccroryi]|uniref:ABC-type Fe3+-siderophore transport system, permease component n=1 Tax=Serpentinimonas maccroryi TaxID=1458426 RepID=A0A060NQZ9_9BURK|nr:iron ABC transporter permease [Serpentinimonas maccroryi]MCM2479942.1 iron ABC transporter permease [Serpentinimonas maccroryi]BAO83785.1 ABC-type Fe3+-siderophore transport system, permease component [Serpentinimonas maccroryi]